MKSSREFQAHRAVRCSPQHLGDRHRIARRERPRLDASSHRVDHWLQAPPGVRLALGGRHEVRDNTLEHHSVVSRILECVPAIGVREIPESRQRIVPSRHVLERDPQPIEALPVELVGDTELAPEDLVEHRRRAARLGGDAPHGQRLRPFGHQQPARDVEQRAPQCFVALFLSLCIRRAFLLCRRRASTR